MAKQVKKAAGGIIVPDKLRKLPTELKVPIFRKAKGRHRIYIHASAFFPVASASGYIDDYQGGRMSAVPDGFLRAPIVLPVGAKLLSFSVHYVNTTKEEKLSFFLRHHADRHSPSGEIEMSFINLPSTTLPPDDYLTVTDTSFPDSGIIKDRFLHYFEIPTGNYGRKGKVAIRGVSITYAYNY